MLRLKWNVITEADVSVASTSKRSKESQYTYILANVGTVSLTKYALEAQGLVAIPLHKLIISPAFFIWRMG